MKTDAGRYPCIGFLLLSAFTRMANAVFLLREDVMEPPLKLREALTVQGVENILSLPPVIDNTGLNEDLHVVGEGGLGDVERLQDLAGAQLPAGEHIHDAQALGIRDRLEHLRGVHIDLLHAHALLWNRILSI